MHRRFAEFGEIGSRSLHDRQRRRHPHATALQDGANAAIEQSEPGGTRPQMQIILFVQQFESIAKCKRTLPRKNTDRLSAYC
jgi:hypothetical protein